MTPRRREFYIKPKGKGQSTSTKISAIQRLRNIKTQKYQNIMKSIFSIATLITLASALVSAAPLARRGQFTATTFGATTYYNVNNIFQGSTDPILPPVGTSTAEISIADGSHEIDSIVSFTIPPDVITSTSTCTFFIAGIAPPTGSGILALYTLGSEFISPFTSVPFYNQYEGQYNLQTGNSADIDRVTVPCSVYSDNTMQFVMRPVGDNDFITWTQSAGVGAFIEID